MIDKLISWFFDAPKGKETDSTMSDFANRKKDYCTKNTDDAVRGSFAAINTADGYGRADKRCNFTADNAKGYNYATDKNRGNFSAGTVVDKFNSAKNVRGSFAVDSVNECDCDISALFASAKGLNTDERMLARAKVNL